MTSSPLKDMETTDVRSTLAEALASNDAIDFQTLNLACFWMTRVLDEQRFPGEEPAAVARLLLRTAGRIFVDVGRPDATVDDWEQTRSMVLLWLNETLQLMGYEAKPAAGSGQPELKEPAEDWL
jgi:hypothetical protein